MRIALINSGLGLLTAAAWLHRLRPDADLVLAMDPDGMPWGARTPADIAQRSLSCARAAAAYQPDVLVFACNTGSVHALGALRAEFEPGIPVVGTVPAIKPAAAASDMIAIWATWLRRLPAPGWPMRSTRATSRQPASRYPMRPRARPPAAERSCSAAPSTNLPLT